MSTDTLPLSLSSLPPYRSQEALILQRRLQLMLFQTTISTASSLYCLRDVSSLDNVIDLLQKIRDQEGSEQILKVHFEKPDESDDDEE